MIHIWFPIFLSEEISFLQVFSEDFRADSVVENLLIPTKDSSDDENEIYGALTYTPCVKEDYHWLLIKLKFPQKLHHFFVLYRLKSKKMSSKLSSWTGLDSLSHPNISRFSIIRLSPIIDNHMTEWSTINEIYIKVSRLPFDES